MNGCRQETTYMGYEAKLGSKDRCDEYTNKPRENRGPSGDGLWTAQSGRAVKPRLYPVALYPVGGYSEKKQEKVVERNDTC